MKILQLNLLPEHPRLETRYVIWQIVAIRLGVLGMGVVVCATAALLSSYFLLSFQEAEVRRAVALEEQNPLRKDAERVADAVAEANGEIRALKSALAADKPVSQMAIAILSQVPQGLRLTHIEFQRSARRFLIAGVAESRDGVLQLEERFRGLSLSEDVVSPLANIIRDADITFAMQVVVKP